MCELKVLAYYPIFIKPYKDKFRSRILVFIPDFKIYTETEGKSIDETIDVAKEAITMTLFESRRFVKPSDFVEAHEKARKDADDICDYSQNSILTFVEVDISDYVNWNLYKFEDTESEDNNEERLKKLEEELDYAKFCHDLDRRLKFKGDKI